MDMIKTYLIDAREDLKLMHKTKLLAYGMPHFTIAFMFVAMMSFSIIPLIKMALR